MGKPGSAAKAQESEMSQKPQGVGKETAPHHTSASPAVYRRILCAHLHTELAALHCSTPHFLLPDFLQPHFTSTVLTPQTLGCPSGAFQSSWAELGLWGHSTLLSSGSLAPGHLSFSWRMENWHLVSPEAEGLLWHKLWNLGCFIFLPFFSFVLSYGSYFVFLPTHTCVDLHRSFHFFLTQSRSRNAALWFPLLCWNKPVCLQQGSHVVTTSDLKSDEN